MVANPHRRNASFGLWLMLVGGGLQGQNLDKPGPAPVVEIQCEDCPRTAQITRPPGIGEDRDYFFTIEIEDPTVARIFAPGAASATASASFHLPAGLSIAPVKFFGLRCTETTYTLTGRFSEVGTQVFADRSAIAVASMLPSARAITLISEEVDELRFTRFGPAAERTTSIEWDSESTAGDGDAFCAEVVSFERNPPRPVDIPPGAEQVARFTVSADGDYIGDVVCVFDHLDEFGLVGSKRIRVRVIEQPEPSNECPLREQRQVAIEGSLAVIEDGRGDASASGLMDGDRIGCVIFDAEDGMDLSCAGLPNQFIDLNTLDEEACSVTSAAPTSDGTGLIRGLITFEDGRFVIEIEFDSLATTIPPAERSRVRIEADLPVIGVSPSLSASEVSRFGGALSLWVNPVGDPSWEVTTDSPQVTIAGPRSGEVPFPAPRQEQGSSVSGSGSAGLTLIVDENTEPAARSATITVNGEELTLRQEGTESRRPAIFPGGVLQGATFTPQITSGGWTTILGQFPIETARTWQGEDFQTVSELRYTSPREGFTLLPTELDGVSVMVGGRPAFVQFISGTQLNVLVDDDAAIGPVDVTVTTAEGTSVATRAVKAAFAPEFFRFDPNGRIYVAAVHLDRTLVGAADLFGGAATARPARPGEIVQIFGAGWGPTDPPTPTDRLVAAPAPLANQVAVRIGGVEAEVQFAGIVGSGLYQLNVVIPELSAGDHEVEASVAGVSLAAPAFITTGG